MVSTLARGQDMLTGALANYNIYRCRDGKYLAVGSLEPKFLPPFKGNYPCVFMAKEKAKKASSLRNKPKKAAGSNDAVYKLANNPKKLRRLMRPIRWAIQLILLTKTRDQWEAKLAHKDTCVSSILTLEEACKTNKSARVAWSAKAKKAYSLTRHFALSAHKLAPAQALNWASITGKIFRELSN